MPEKAKCGRKKIEIFSELAPQKREFVNNYLKLLETKGYNIKIGDVAYCAEKAGYLKGLPDSKEKIEKLYKCGNKILNEQPVKEYVYMHKPEIKADVDLNSVVERLGLIMQGNIEQKIVDKNGDEHYQPPDFKEQVMAANALISVFKLQEKNAKPADIIKVASTRLDAITESIKNEFS